MFYDNNDLLGAVNNFKSMDVSALLEKCNEWNISPYDLKEDVDSMGFEAVNDINILFYSIYHLRLNQIIDQIENINFHFEEEQEAEIFNNFKEKLCEQLQEANIHCNCLCSCFDDELANRLDDAKDIEDEVFQIFSEAKENHFNWFFN
jgi:hypothetical protein